MLLSPPPKCEIEKSLIDIISHTGINDNHRFQKTSSTIGRNSVRTLRKLFLQQFILCVGLMLLCGFLLVPSYATERYFSNTKSPTGVMEPRDMYFPRTEKLASDEMESFLAAQACRQPAAVRPRPVGWSNSVTGISSYSTSAQVLPRILPVSTFPMTILTRSS